MPERPTRLLQQLERLKIEYGAGVGPRKLTLLVGLGKRRLERADEVLRLHEVLCFLRAYPDDAELLAQVERMLAGFHRRGDLRRHRRTLEDTGIAGTSIRFRFFAPEARWLARRWGGRLTIDWKRFRNHAQLEPFLGLLALYAETPGLDECAGTVREWMERFKGPGETDAVFLLRRLDGLRLDPFLRERLYDALDPALRLTPGPTTPSRSRAKYARLDLAYQTGPLRRARPRLLAEVAVPPLAVRELTPREGGRLIDLAREAMVTRSRDLNAFSYGERQDVRLVDCGQGLQFACIGIIPQRRFLLEATYGFLTLKNGVPIGYALALALFGSAAVSYNVFATFRGGEAAHVFGRFLASLRHLLGSDSFWIDSYQLGLDNKEGLTSGAWWFYQKLGFRPRQASALRLMRQELRRMRLDSRHRSGPSTLEELARAELFLYLGPPRDDVLGVLFLGEVGLRVTRHLAERFGSNRARASRVCAQDAARALGVPSLGRFSPGERLAWDRWAPLVTVLPGLLGWNRRDKRALVDVVRAKGGRREADYLRHFDAHGRLRSALRRLARG